MQSNLFTAVLLPLALAMVMLGMGLSLVPEDFKRITRYPKAVAVGTVCQILLLPLIGALIAWVVPIGLWTRSRLKRDEHYVKKG